jgi:hypothetical protein
VCSCAVDVAQHLSSGPAAAQQEEHLSNQPTQDILQPAALLTLGVVVLTHQQLPGAKLMCFPKLTAVLHTHTHTHTTPCVHKHRAVLAPPASLFHTQQPPAATPPLLTDPNTPIPLTRCFIWTHPQGVPSLRDLALLLQHNAWARSCAPLGQLTQLASLAIKGQPLNEAAKHGAGSMAAGLWVQAVCPLVGLTRLEVNPWLKAAAEDQGGSCVCFWGGFGGGAEGGCEVAERGG